MLLARAELRAANGLAVARANSPQKPEPCLTQPRAVVRRKSPRRCLPPQVCRSGPKACRGSREPLPIGLAVTQEGAPPSTQRQYPLSGCVRVSESPWDRLLPEKVAQVFATRGQRTIAQDLS